MTTQEEIDALKALVVKKDEALRPCYERLERAASSMYGGTIPESLEVLLSHAKATLRLTPADLADCCVVKREEWDKAYGYAARIDKELDAIRVLADELACSLNLNKGKADHE